MKMGILYWEMTNPHLGMWNSKNKNHIRCFKINTSIYICKTWKWKLLEWNGKKKMNFDTLKDMLSLDDHFNSLTPLHQQRLMELIIRTINGDYKHNSLPIMNVFNPMVSLPSKKMKKLFLNRIRAKRWLSMAL